MAITKIDYCSWDGDPALLINYDDGRIHGFSFQDGDWNQGNAADIAMEAALMTKAGFEKRWPNVTLPNKFQLETASSKELEEQPQH
jgi:hypothetical protein